jgi:hypothetical protein
MLHLALAILVLDAPVDADEAALRGRARDVTYYDFGGDGVPGRIDRPGHTEITARVRLRFRGFLTVPGSFTPELVRVAKDV